MGGFNHPEMKWKRVWRDVDERRCIRIGCRLNKHLFGIKGLMLFSTWKGE